MTGRYAPSPTGALHLGNIRTALLAWLHSRALGGRHILRFEDLDTGRVRPWAYDVTRRDLAWLGLDWDAEYCQSDRLNLYAAALDRLPTYRCTCTRREIQHAMQAAGSAPHGAELIYPGTCRERLGAGVEAGAMGRPVSADFRPSALRWRVPDRTCCAHDSLSGETLCQSLRSDVGDLVLQRSDGVYAYHLAAVVDDAAMGVTEVVRGADLWPAAPRQRALGEALGAPPVRYWHVPMMTDYAGERLAKRGGAPSLRDLREGGQVTPGAIVASLARSLDWRRGAATGAGAGVATDIPELSAPELTAAELLPLWREFAGLGGAMLPT